MPEFVDVTRAAEALNVNQARVRALIAAGALRADKLGGRWVVDWDSVVARRDAAAGPGRRMSAANAWALLLMASGEDASSLAGQNARWRIRQTLAHHRLLELQGRLGGRAQPRQLWAVRGELRRLLTGPSLVRTGSSAARELQLELAAPDTVDAYVPASRLDALVREHGLEPAAASEANVTLRAVPDGAWAFGERRVAPLAAVGLDLAGYRDPRSKRVGIEVLERLDRERTGA